MGRTRIQVEGQRHRDKLDSHIETKRGKKTKTTRETDDNTDGDTSLSNASLFRKLDSGLSILGLLY